MKVSFIGSGNMAQSMLGGMCHSGWPANDLHACDPNPEPLQSLADTLGIHTHTDNIQGIAAADAIVLAVKPQILPEVAQNLHSQLPDQSLIISIAAGITTDALRNWLGTDLPIVRAMPNTPALVQQGMTGLFSTQALPEPQRLLVENIFTSIGKFLWVEKEQQIDAVTAISGSGPAYFFLFFEAVEAAAQSLGLSPEVAAELIQQTALGAATMAQQSTQSSETLKKNVMSPGGTTEQAIHALMAAQFPETIATALQQAYQRSLELSKA